MPYVPTTGTTDNDPVSFGDPSRERTLPRVPTIPRAGPLPTVKVTVTLLPAAANFYSYAIACQWCGRTETHTVNGITPGRVRARCGGGWFEVSVERVR